MPLTAREAFKVAFINQCLKEGCTVDEIHERVKLGREKLAGVTDIVTKPVGAGLAGLGNALGQVGYLGAIGALAAPPILGATTGWAASQATDIDEHDATAQKQRELIAEYKRLTDQAKRNRLAKAYAQRRKETGLMFV